MPENGRAFPDGGTVPVSGARDPPGAVWGGDIPSCRRQGPLALPSFAAGPSIEQTTEQPEQFPVQRTWEIILTNPSMVAANNEDSESDGRNYNALSLLRAEVAKAKAIPAIARRRAAR
jgi:hypothetical protein